MVRGPNVWLAYHKICKMSNVCLVLCESCKLIYTWVGYRMDAMQVNTPYNNRKIGWIFENRVSLSLNMLIQTFNLWTYGYCFLPLPVIHISLRWHRSLSYLISKPKLTYGWRRFLSTEPKYIRYQTTSLVHPINYQHFIIWFPQ